MSIVTGGCSPMFLTIWRRIRIGWQFPHTAIIGNSRASRPRDLPTASYTELMMEWAR